LTVKKEYLAIFRGDNSGAVMVRVFDAGITPVSSYVLPLYRINHSSARFAWGYHGSRPNVLAFAILVDHLGDRVRAMDLYREFSRKVIATLDRREGWTLTGDQIESSIASIENQRMAWV
jgi:hypothetical protein